MGRTFHCSFDTLKRICETLPGWMVTALGSFDAINVRVEEDLSLPSEEDYIRMASGDVSPMNTTDDLFMEVDSIERGFNLPHVLTFTHWDTTDWEPYTNDVFVSDAFPSGVKFPEGVSLMNTPDFESLIQGWEDPTYKNEEFSWADFFRNPIPTSNSVLLVDRYIFKSVKNKPKRYRQGVMNLSDILVQVVPDDFKGEYRVMIIFDRMQLESQETHTVLFDAISDIDALLRANLKGKKCTFRFEYLAVCNSADTRTQEEKNQKALYQKTHDRVMYSNYYTVKVTHAFVAYRCTKDNVKISTEDQTLSIRTILHNIDRKGQKRDSIPINGDRRGIGSLLSLIINADPAKTTCLCTTDSIRVPVAIPLDRLENRILKLAVC